MDNKGLTEEQEQAELADGFMRQIEMYQGIGPSKMHQLVEHFWDNQVTDKKKTNLSYPWMTGPIAGNEQ